MAVHAIVAAAGRGERAGGGVPKQLWTVRGRSLLLWAVTRLQAAHVDSLVVAIPAEQREDVTTALRSVPDVLVVVGGATRQESVASALAASPARAEDLVIVHDAARAAVHPDDVRATIAAAATAEGAVLGRPVTDTIKSLDGQAIVATVDRAQLFRAETPQVFRRELLERALAHASAAGFIGTDESVLVERLGFARIVAVSARWPNPKITFAADLEPLEALLGAQRLEEDSR